ncbi:MAG: DUF1343 domain-containing protein [Chloroflexi bacterium]|nr:DUF1343 domain-containing protein [Chloroflexota bacterium]
MHVKSGLQVLLDEGKQLSGARAGLVTHPAAVLPDLRHSLEALQAAGVQISALFGPEHGYLGFEADATQVTHTVDPRTGIPAYSLYGDHLSPTPEMLDGLDVLLFDMQDVGVRFYTFISTLYHVLKAAGEQGKPIIVLDRPNPLGGVAAEGPLIDRGYESFVGITSLPIQHGMTVGELAGWMNTRLSLKADLQVIPVLGWDRNMLFNDTGLPWAPTSPGIPHLSTVFAYPCTCLIEGTNLSEGRGTALPFEVFGAPWLAGYALAEALNQAELPGVRFRPTHFQPGDSKYRGSVCQGVQLHITDPRQFQSLPCGLVILQKLIESTPQFSFLETSWEGNHPHFDLLVGNSAIRTQLLAGVSLDVITSGWGDNLSAFNKDRTDFLLYE